MERAYEILRDVFGYESFREGQEDAIRAVLVEKKDVFVLMPTGAGKSLCYSIPALYWTDGIVFVVSPLIALMEDQETSLRAKGIAAAHLASSRCEHERFRPLFVLDTRKKSRSGKKDLRLRAGLFRIHVSAAQLRICHAACSAFKRATRRSMKPL